MNKQQLLGEKNHDLKFLGVLLSDRFRVAQRKHFGSSSEKYVGSHEQLYLFTEVYGAAMLDKMEELLKDGIPEKYLHKYFETGSK